MKVVYYVGIVGMSTKLKKGLRISYCRIIWFEGGVNGEWSLMAASGKRRWIKACCYSDTHNGKTDHGLLLIAGFAMRFRNQCGSGCWEVQVQL